MNPKAKDAYFYLRDLRKGEEVLFLLWDSRYNHLEKLQKYLCITKRKLEKEKAGIKYQTKQVKNQRGVIVWRIA